MRLLHIPLLSFFFSLTSVQLVFANQSPHSQPSLHIAPAEQALTFARTSAKHGNKTILVTSYSNNMISGKDLSNAFLPGELDAIDLYSRHGYEPIKNMLLDEQRYPTVQIPLSNLALPVLLADTHIAIGTNYREHAKETDVTKTPFLFSKRVTPTQWNAKVTSQSRALDYEAEVAMVVLSDLTHPEIPTQVGLILCNDVSDREILMHHVDPSDIESGKGFAQGKSAPGLLPVGNLFVIPNATDEFMNNLVMQLMVNDSIRQHGQVNQLIWQRRDIFNEIWRNRSRVWQYDGATIQLLSKPNTIPVRTLVLTGTPAGTVFQGIPFMTKLKGLARWLMSGMDQSIQYHVVEQYLSENESHYLQTRDQIQIISPLLGTLNNQVSTPYVKDGPAYSESTLQ